MRQEREIEADRVVEKEKTKVRKIKKEERERGGRGRRS